MADLHRRGSSRDPGRQPSAQQFFPSLDDFVCLYRVAGARRLDGRDLNRLGCGDPPLFYNGRIGVVFLRESNLEVDRLDMALSNSLLAR